MALTAFVGVDGHVFVDEGAHYGQIEALDRGAWLVDAPLAAADPEARFAPMDRAGIAASGDYAPFVNHPASAWIGVAADRVGGRWGVRSASVVGAVVAAGCAALLAEGMRARAGVGALWITGLLSPLVFDSQLVVAHTMAAAVVGIAALWWVGERRGTVAAVGMGIATLAGVLLRSESLVLAAAVVAVGGVQFLRSRDLGLAWRVGGTFVGAAVGYVLEPRWVASLFESATDVNVRTVSETSRGGLSGRLEALHIVLVRPSYDGLVPPLIDVLLVAAVVGAAAGTMFAVRNRIDLARPVLVLAVVAAAIRLTDPTVTSGLLLAFPLLAVGGGLVLFGVHRPEGLEAAVLAVVGVFALGVAATQYQEAGGFEWGWRYLAIAMPLLVPSLAIGLRSLSGRLDPAWSRQVIGAVVVVSGLVVASGLLEQRAIVDRTDRLHERLDALSADADRLLFLDPLLGRAMWQLSLDGRVVEAERATAPEALDLLIEAGDADVLVVWLGEPALPIATADFSEGPVIEVGIGDLRAVRLRR